MSLPEIQDLVAVLVGDVRAVGGDDARGKGPQEPDGVAAAVDEDAQGLRVEGRRTGRMTLVFRREVGEQPGVVSSFHRQVENNGKAPGGSRRLSLYLAGQVIVRPWCNLPGFDANT